MAAPTPNSRSISIAQLIGEYEDQDFVHAAYRTLLGREADPGGLESYTAQLRRGVRKAELLWSLAVSDEGRQAASTHKPEGLDSLLRAEHARRHPGVMYRVWRKLAGPDALDAEEARRELRVAVNRSFVLQQSVDQLHRDLEQARGELVQLKDIVGALQRPAGSPGQHATGNAVNQEACPEIVPPRAGALLRAMRRYSALRAARTDLRN